MIRLLIVITVLFLLAPGVSYAYLDPGTGSYVLQIIIGIVLGAALAVKAFWYRIKTFFTGSFFRKRKGH